MFLINAFGGDKGTNLFARNKGRGQIFHFSMILAFAEYGLFSYLCGHEAARRYGTGAHSSVGQSSGLIIRRSWDHAPLGPQKRDRHSGGPFFVSWVEGGAFLRVREALPNLGKPFLQTGPAPCRNIPANRPSEPPGKPARQTIPVLQAAPAKRPANRPGKTPGTGFRPSRRPTGVSLRSFWRHRRPCESPYGGSCR